MYPRLSDLFTDLFGIHFPLPIYSFGAMVAIGVLTAAWLSGKELDRLYGLGRLNSVRVPALPEKGKEKKKEKGKKQRAKLVDASPSVLMGNVTVIAVVGGFLGAKVFHILENLDQFFQSPGDMLFSTGGFTFYGGLVVAALGIAWYVRSKGLSVSLFADAVAPGLMLAYGIGRIGCHLSGDGDWGEAANLAAKPDWLPMWLWAETYPNGTFNLAQPLDPAVYPTPLYEFAMAAVLFGVLWMLRKNPYVAGWLFSFYLILNGAERLLIEQIRVNNTFDLFGLTVTQAEVISTVLILAGVFGLIRTWRKRQADLQAAPA